MREHQNGSTKKFTVLFYPIYDFGESLLLSGIGFAK
jgi:hypothetical protein